jgi:hypothetical protein
MLSRVAPTLERREGELGTAGAGAAGERFLRLANGELDRAYRLAGMLLGDQGEAEDATQDALVRAWQAAGSLRDPAGFEFAGTGRPGLTVAVASPPFVGDASGNPIVVPGKAFLTLKLYDASDYPTYTGPGSISAGYPRLTALVNNGDYEGYVSWVAGLTGPACYRISTRIGPTRIVVDIQAP